MRAAPRGIAALLAALAPATAVAGAGSSDYRPDGACAGPRAEYAYPIELKGPPALSGFRVGSFAAFRRDAAGRWGEIPIQVDEVNERGDYVLAGGLPFTKATDDGWLDDNDEVVLDGRDLGEEFEPKDVPADIARQARAQWKLTMCRGAQHVGTALVVTRRETKVWRGAPAVSFDAGRGVVDSELYTYAFHRQNPVLLGEVALRDASGARLPALAESRFQMPLVTPFFMPNITLKDADFTSSIESWQVGPLRAIVAVGVKYESFLSLFKLHLFSELVFYRNRFKIPTVIEFIFDPSRFLSPGSGIAYSLRFPPGRAWDVETNLAPLPAEEPRDVVAKGVRASADESYWARGSRPDGSFLVTVRVDEKARAQVPPPFLARREDFAREALVDHWPWLAKIPGDLGVFLDFSGIKKGAYDFGLDLLLSPKAHESFTDYGTVAPHWQPLPSPPPR